MLPEAGKGNLPCGEVYSAAIDVNRGRQAENFCRLEAVNCGRTRDTVFEFILWAESAQVEGAGHDPAETELPVRLNPQRFHVTRPP